ARHQVEGYLAGMFNPTVQLRSGGYIVIDATEALVAIDVNSGRATKEGSIEETALKTNLEAAEEVARQLRLRDLAGLIVIDFIDMEERRNNNAVEKRMKDKLKTDRARIQVGRISGFGLLEMSRQRLRPGMIEATTQPCSHCHGTGLIRSDDNLALSILRQLEEEGTRRRSREVLLKAPVGIVNFLINHKREHVAQIEARYGMAVRIEADPFLVSPDFSIEKYKTATRVVAEAAPVVSGSSALMSQIDAVEEETEEEVAAEAISEEAPKPKKRRRRRRRRRSSGSETSPEETAEVSSGAAPEAGPETGDAAETPAAPVAAEENTPGPEQLASSSEDAPGDTAADTGAEAPGDDAAQAAEKPKTSRSRRTTRKKPAPSDSEKAQTAKEDEAEKPAEEPAEKPKRKTSTKKTTTKKTTTKKTATKAKSTAKAAPEDTQEVAESDADDAPKPARKVTRKRSTAKKAPSRAAAAETAPSAPSEAPEAPASVGPAAEPQPVPAAELASEAETETPDKPKKKGWWSLGR
ncbi:MAG TPA: ribonuclease E/G, partial [Rhodobacteraceae bacterium]|nr:ribonuclease E/G [Paracoccaceae bacterium]